MILRDRQPLWQTWRIGLLDILKCRTIKLKNTVSRRIPHFESHVTEVSSPVIELMKMYTTHYNVVTCNCQHFARDLALLIIDPTIVEPEFGARYRFTRHHLKVATTFQYSGPTPGWIIPSKKTILVNVTQDADDPDTWEGEVEGTEQRGKFLRTFIVTFLWCYWYLRSSGYTVEHA